MKGFACSACNARRNPDGLVAAARQSLEAWIARDRAA